MAAPSKQSKIILGGIQLKYWGAGGCIPYMVGLVGIYFVSSLQLSQFNRAVVDI